MKMKPDCPFNAMLDCPPGEAHNCKKCGWNPKVAEERLERVKQIFLGEGADLKRAMEGLRQ